MVMTLAKNPPSDGNGWIAYLKKKKKKKKHVLIFIFQILDWLTYFVVVYVRSSFFIIVVAIFILHGFPLICVYSFCSTWIASIYICTYNTWIFSLESISPFCVL